MQSSAPTVGPLRVLAFLSIVTTGTTAVAQDTIPPHKINSGAEALESLRAELEEAQRAWLKKYREATNDEERAEFENNTLNSPLRSFERRFLQLAQQYASEPTAIEAVQWLAETADPGPVFDDGLALIQRHHIENRSMEKLCQTLVYRITPGIEKLMFAVATKNPHRDVRGLAYLSQARYLKNLREIAASLEQADEQKLRRLKQHYSDDVLKWIRATDPAKLSAQIDTLCHQVIEEYGDVKHGRRTLADAADALLFEMHAVGRAAPEIDGEDVDGARFRLSDYRGKVVVLDFWGHW